MVEGPIIGIDLGTTFSAVGFVRDGRSVILPNGQEHIVPSVVGFDPDGKLLVGTPALNQYVLYPERTVRSIKRRMGSGETVSLNGRSYTPVEISALILREMKRIAEANLGQSVTRAVITVPAYFSDAARQATHEAGELAGFTVERIINEPTAAALAYGLDRKEERQVVAVYDLGGGTFDVSIIELNEGVIEVLASHGDTHLGGDDFDERLMETLADRVQEKTGVDPREDRRAKARLIRAAEQAKIGLSSQPFVRVREEYLLEKDGHPQHLDEEVSRADFEGLIEDLVENTLTAFDQALADADLNTADLDRILFVGGSTRIPLVWEMVAQHTGIEPLVAINPDEAVALGAGVQAAIIAGESLDTILVDVAPHALGIEVVEFNFDEIIPGRYSVIIPRNTTLPANRSQVFSALTPDQTAIEVKVYQGEAPTAAQNTLLGQFLFEDLKPDAPGEPPHITVGFDLDLNGILKISAIDRGSRQVKQTTLQAAHVRLDAAGIQNARQSLDALWEGEGSPVESERSEGEDVVLQRAEALMTTRLSEVAPLAELVERLKAARRAGNQAEAQQLEDELLELLYELEEGEEGS
jgi:molecular chaperone DnaK